MCTKWVVLVSPCGEAGLMTSRLQGLVVMQVQVQVALTL